MCETITKPPLTPIKQNEDFIKSMLNYRYFPQKIFQEGKLHVQEKKRNSEQINMTSHQILPPIHSFDPSNQNLLFNHDLSNMPKNKDEKLSQNNNSVIQKLNKKESLNKYSADLESTDLSRETAILYLEGISKRLGFRLHSKRGFLVLRQFFIFLFPKGMNPAPPQTRIKRLNIEEFASIIKQADLAFPGLFTKEKFEQFQKLENEKAYKNVK
jgi:hypothetical protein